MFLILCFAGFAIGIGFVRGAIDAAPSLDILDVQPQGYASQIYDSDGNLMQTLVMEGSNREEVSFDQLPDDLVILLQEIVPEFCGAVCQPCLSRSRPEAHYF